VGGSVRTPQICLTAYLLGCDVDIYQDGHELATVV
jgi:hypothetical protein